MTRRKGRAVDVFAPKRISETKKGGAVVTKKIFSKQGVPRFMKVVLAIALVISAIPIGAFASEENDPASVPAESTVETTEVTEAATEEPAADSAVEPAPEAVDAQEETELIDETTTGEEAEESGVAGSLEGGVSVRSGSFASFNGADIVGADDAFTTSWTDSYKLPRYLNVAETFTDTFQPKRVEIVIKNGLGMDSAPGMVQTSTAQNDWTFNESILAPYLQGVIVDAEWVQDAPILGYQVRSGKLIYTLSDMATDFNVSIGIEADSMLIKYQDDQVLANAISATSYENNVQINTAALEKYTISKSGAYWVYSHSNINTVTVARNADWEFTDYFVYFVNGSWGDLLQQGVTLKFSMPKEAGLQGIKLGTDSSVAAAYFEAGAVDSSSSTTHDFITIKIKAGAAMTKANFTLYGKVSDAAIPGTTLHPELVDSEVIRWDNTKTTAIKHSMHYLYIAKEDNIYTMGDTNNIVYSQEVSSPAAQRLLGIFSMKNEQVDTLSGRRALFSFSSTSYGVTAVKVMAGDNGATDIVATTTLGNNIYIASAPITTNGEGSPPNSKYAYIDFSSYLAAGEYISTVEYSIGDTPSGAITLNTIGDGADIRGVGFYGKLLASSGSYSATLTIKTPTVASPDYTDPTHWQAGESCTSTNTITATANPAADIATTNANVGSGTLIAGNSAFRTISATFTPHSYRYSEVIHAWKGYVIYVREAPGLYIDPSSIKVTWTGYGGNQVFAPDSIDGYLDKDGNKVYRITMSDAIMGYGTNANGHYGTFVASAKVRATSSADTTTIPLYEVFQSKVLNSTNNTRYRSYAGTFYETKDKFEVTGDANNYLVCPTSGYVLNLQASSDFSVATSADKGDGAWKTYQPGIDSTIIGLNTQLGARYRVDMKNNSGEPISGGVSILIPIPKAGETTGEAAIQSSAFEWDMYLEEEVVKAGYTVTYATSYTLDKDSANWVDWSSVSGNTDNIRMIMFSRSDTLAEDFEDDFYFDLAVPDATTAETNNWQGKVNTFSALVNAVVKGSGAYRPSEPVALRLNTGIISGTVYMDVDRSGAIDAGDTGVGGVVVSAYDSTSGDFIESATTANDGTYKLYSLSDTDVDLIFTNPSTTSTPMRYVLPSIEAGSLLTEADVTPGVDPTNPVVVNGLLQQPYTVSFSLPTGSTTVTDQKVYPGGTATQPSPDPQKDYHAFKGWFTTDQYTTAWNFSSAIHADTTIYGKMEENTYGYTVEYYAESVSGTKLGSANGTTKVAAGDSLTLATVQGDLGANWLNAEKPAVGYSNGATSDLPFTMTNTAANNVIKVVYSLNMHAITYVYDGSQPSGAPAVPAAVPNATYNTAQQRSATPATGISASVAGYTFNGWTTSDVMVASDGSFTMPDKAVTFTGSWSANKHTVTYNANSGTGSVASQTVYYDKNWATQANGFSKTGYTFAGWNTAANGSGTSYSAGQTSTYTYDKDITLYAQWDPASGVAYRVEHYLVDANNSPTLNFTENRTGTTGQTASAAATAYAGYTYNAGYPGTIASATIAPDGSTVLRLYYTINYYTVTFLDWNGATLALRSVPFGGNAFAPNNPYRLGYTFTGWDRGYTNVTSNITVNATYAPLTFTVVFVDYNDEVIQTSTVNYGESVTPPTNPTRSGYTFTGWDRGSDAWTNVTADATIKARYDNETTTRPPITRTETTTTNNGGGDDPTTPAERLEKAAAEQNIPSIGVPLAAPQGFAAWALANLIFAVVGAVMALVFTVIRSMRKNDEKEDEEDREDREDQQEKLRHRRSFGWIIGTLVLAIAGLLLFVFTQDISLPMVWFDMWTIVHVILFIALLVLGNVAIRRKKIKPKEEDEGQIQQGGTPVTA